MSNALQCNVGRFCFYRKLASMFPPPSTDHGLISSNIKEGGNIDVQSRDAFTYQVSSVSGGTVTLSGDMITPSSIVAFTFEVTALTIGARCTGVCTNSSLKCQHFSTNQSATSEKISGNVTLLHWHYRHRRPGKTMGGNNKTRTMSQWLMFSARPLSAGAMTWSSVLV